MSTVGGIYIVQCGGKTGYATAARAHAVLKARLRIKGNALLNVYHCSYCGHWHIGNTQPERDRNWKKREAYRLAQEAPE